jgi:hypothetical protein
MSEDDNIYRLADFQEHSELPSHVEDALALEFAAQHQDKLRYVAKWNRWLMYDGKRWAEDDTLHIFDLVRALCRSNCKPLETWAKRNVGIAIGAIAPGRGRGKTRQFTPT